MADAGFWLLGDGEVVMTQDGQSELLAALDAMRIEPAGAVLTFSQRLARENDWTIDFSDRVFAEYKRFLFLAITCEHAVTPSDEVDQAWHLHLTYSRHYWEILCGAILKHPLHHGPTEGGHQEDKRYFSQYSRTLEGYITAFGRNPPKDIWPAPDIRFGLQYRRIREGQYWMLPKKAVYAGALLLTLAACTENKVVVGFSIFFGIIAFVAIMAILENASTKKRKKDKNGNGCSGASGCSSISSDSSSSSESSGCGSGCGGCGS